MTEAQILQIAQACAELSLLGGFAGAIVALMVVSMLSSIWAAVEQTEWYQDWSDRQYVRWLNSDTAKRVVEARKRSQGGFVGLSSVITMAVVLVSVLTACGTGYDLSDPDVKAHRDWVERVKAYQW